MTLLIPSGAVGAIIGSRGSHIRNISRIAGASIRIHVSSSFDFFYTEQKFQPPDEAKESDKEIEQGGPKSDSDKDGKNVNFEMFADFMIDTSARVTIVGQPEAQWKAQFCIYDKLKQEGWFGSEEGRLTSQITIPGVLVGRVIGKGGVNVRELQVLLLINSEPKAILALDLVGSNHTASGRNCCI